MAEYDAKKISEDFFASKNLNISKKTDLKKAVAFIQKAKWQDMFVSEKRDSIEYSELDEKVGKKRLKIVKEYLEK